jgi:AraC family transcriptional regulator
LPPHQYVIARRVDRAQHLLRRDGELGLAEVAFRVGFSDQPFFLSLQADRRRHARTVSDFRKNLVKEREPIQEIDGWRQESVR